MQGRAHVVEDLSAVDTQFVDYSSVRDIWKKEIEASECELQERKEEESVAAKAAAANIERIDDKRLAHMEEEWIVCTTNRAARERKCTLTFSFLLDCTNNPCEAIGNCYKYEQ